MFQRFFDRLKGRPRKADPPPAVDGTDDVVPVDAGALVSYAEQKAAASQASSAAPAGAPVSPDEIKAKAIEVLKTVYDPEIPVNIYELGLVYGLRVEASGMVFVSMTLTSPACPVAGTLPPEVQAKLRAVPGVRDVVVDLVWDPPWSPERMSEAAKLQLGML